MIINADATQVYRDLRILSARPSEEEEARVPHRLFGHRDGADAYSAAAWADEARAAIAEAHAAGRLPILVGGTGLYLRTVLEGIAPIPEIALDVRRAVRALGAAQAHVALVREDPVAAERLHPNDTARLQRALEVVRATGRPIGQWRESRIGGIGDRVSIDRQTIVKSVTELNACCDARVDWMIANGAAEEADQLRCRGLDPSLPVMRAIGIPQLIQYLDGKRSLSEAVDAIKLATRAYAKRQRTWLRHQSV